MDHQLNSFSWDVLGSTLCLPQAVPHVGWVLTNVEARSAKGSSKSLNSHPSTGNFHSTNDFIEDVLSSQSLFDDGFNSPVSFTSAPQETVAFDFNFLPSSPESVDFLHLDGLGTETFDLESVSDMLVDKSLSTIKTSPTPENVKVEQAVEDPDVALKLIQHLSTDPLNNDVSINLMDSQSTRNNLDAHFIPLNVLPVGDASFVSSQTLATSPAFEFTSVAPTNVVSFHVDNFFAAPLVDSHQGSIPSANSVIVSSQNACAFTLRDLVCMSDGKQVALAQCPVISQNAAPVTMDSISFEDIVVPQQSSPSAIRPEKRQRKKEQNKNAAQKYRQKKRAEQGNFLSECQETEKKNSELKLRVNEITREINYLKGLLLEISVA